MLHVDCFPGRMLKRINKPSGRLEWTLVSRPETTCPPTCALPTSSHCLFIFVRRVVGLPESIIPDCLSISVKAVKDDDATTRLHRFVPPQTKQSPSTDAHTE